MHQFMKLLPVIPITLLFLFLVQCQSNTDKPVLASFNAPLLTATADTKPVPEKPDTVKNRLEIIKKLNEKKAKKEPLVVHLYIPLCDNINQGIVPTSESLGNGFNLKTNLYWATSSATKKFFSRHPDWQVVYNEFDIDTNVLERIIFKRNYNGTPVYLAADAYRGDRMQETVNDFFAALSCNKLQKAVLKSSDTIGIAGYSDLVMFNGHNGMMDNIYVKDWKNNGPRQIDAVINACVSYSYFNHQLIRARAYPLVRTKTLLHPGAYVLTQIIDDWVAGKDETTICLNAGRAYCKKHDCGRGTKVYKAGW